MMCENDRMIRQGLPENLSLWSDKSTFYFDNNDYKQEKEIILEFVKLSLDAMDTRFGFRK